MSDLVLPMPARAWDRNGVFVAGATAEFFDPGTTTPRTVYSNAALSVAHPSPLVADARGVFAPVYTNGPVKVVVKDADGVVLPGGTMDPAFSSPASAASADGIAFDATGDIPETDVQAAIERVQLNAEALVSGAGWGITGNAPLLDNFNSTTLASGAFRFDGTTTGTRPTGWVGSEVGVALFLRDTGSSGLMLAADRANGVIWQRQMGSTTWGAWLRLTPNSFDQATWNTGTDTTEAQISPAKLSAAIGNRQQVMHVVDQKANGTAGDNTTATTWATRTLNTTRTNTITGASLASNVVTLPAGRYRVTATDPAYNCDHHRLRLYNVTASAAILNGPNEYARSSADAHVTTATLDGFFTLSVQSDVRLEHWCRFGSGSTFFGLAASTGEPEVYASVIFEWLGAA